MNLTLDPQWIAAIIGAAITLIGALVAVFVLLVRALGNLKAAQVNFETEKVKSATAQVENTRVIDQHKTEIEALKLANEAAELRRRADLAEISAKNAEQLQILNQKQQEDIHALALQIAQMQGRIDTQGKVQDKLEGRLQALSEQKIEIAAQANALQSELDLARSAELETAAALTKANQLNQSYEKRLDDAQQNVSSLQGEVNKLTIQVATLQAQIDGMKETESKRHDQWSDISAQNLRYASLVMQYKIALQTIVGALPVRDMPPKVIADLSARGIDVTYLANLHYDPTMPSPPVRIPEPPADKGDTPAVPIKAVDSKP